MIVALALPMAVAKVPVAVRIELSRSGAAPNVLEKVPQVGLELRRLDRCETGFAQHVWQLGEETKEVLGAVDLGYGRVRVLLGHIAELLALLGVRLVLEVGLAKDVVR